MSYASVGHAVTFANGAVELAGTVTFPAVRGGPGLGGAASGPGGTPVPGVVLIGGSGPSDRDNDGYFPPLRDALVQAGLAVLSYDKRGVGGSSGDWREATLDDLAKDATAALRCLREQPGVRGAQAGWFGHSEGGWVALRAAAGREDIPWVVTNGTPAVSPAAQERYELANRLRVAPGYPARATDAALSLYDRIIEAGRADATFAEVAGLLAEAGNDTWPQGLWGTLDAPLWGFLKRKQDHDPTADARRLRCSRLALFGGADPVVPVAASVRILLAEAGVESGAEGREPHAALTVKVFPEADHRTLVDKGSRFAPGYLDALTRWLREQPAARRQNRDLPGAGAAPADPPGGNVK